MDTADKEIEVAFSQDLTGQQFGSYRLIRRLGVGGFASVYLGQHVRISSKQAAIKILHLFDVNVAQFQQEAETTEQLRHPNIVRLLDFDVQEGTPFLVLDYAPGGSLRARHPKGSQVPLATVIGYLKELVPALQYAHDRNILHRDIKPDNILIGPQAELLLSDFGISLLSQTGRTSAHGPTSTGGTPYYMAPEQFRGKPEKASDQYALATVAYEWLSGTVPFTEGDWIQLGYQHNHEPVPSLRASVHTLPATAEAVVMKALAKQPETRFPTVLAFAQALEATSQQPVLHSLTPPTSSQHPASPEVVHQSIQDQSIEPAQAEEGVYLPQTLPVPPPPTEADQPPLTETETSTPSSSSTTVSTEVPTSPRPVTPAPISRLVLHRRVPNRRMLFTLALVLLIALSGGSLYFIARKPTLSPAQATVTAIAQPYAAGTTSMFGFDAAHTHYNPYEHTLSPTNASRLKPLWSFATGGDVNSSPAVAGGTVYVGSKDGKLYAFDASCRNACQPLWSFLTGGPIYSSPAVAGGMVYVGFNDYRLYAFDASCRNACQPLWSYATGSPIYSSPAVAGGMVYVGSDDGKLYAFDTSCHNACQPLWSFSTGGRTSPLPTIANGMVYVGSDDGKLYAFDASCRNACQPL